MQPTHRFLALALLLALPALAQSPFAWKDLGEGRLELSEQGKPALVYNYGPQLKPDAPEDRRRCCYIFPVYTPAGVSMLDDFPQDHWHHRGLFWAWPVVETGGKTYDLWMNMTVRERQPAPPKTSATAKAALLDSESFWEAEGQYLVRETLRLRVAPSAGPAREFDVELSWEALNAPVTIRGSREKGKSYGGFSARFAARENTVLRADGQTLSEDEDLTPRHWAELEGVYAGKKAVLRITPDAKNRAAPYQWCLRKYGFVGASFPGKSEAVDSFTLQPGKPLTLKFRVRVADVKE